MENKKLTGTKYEVAAAHYLHELGYEILEMNFRTRMGEIDIIAKDSDTYVFCEVKFRTSEDMNKPLEAVDSRKRGRIRACARFFLLRNELSEETPVRFDVIGYTPNEIKHIKDAF